MTFQEILAEVKKLSQEEKNQLSHVLNDDMEATAVQNIFTASTVYEISTPIFGGSLNPLLDLLEQGKQTGELE